MAKGDSGETQQVLNTTGSTVQNQQNQNIGQTQNQYSNLIGNYNQSLNPNRGLAPTSNTITAGAMPFNPSASQYGDLTQPNNWMGVVNNPTQLDAFVKSGLGSQANNQQLIDYYKSKIQGQPGANPTEQAGSAQYWMNKLQNDPNVTGIASQGGPGGISSLAGFQNFADTGGFSPQQIQDIRARDIAPTRAIYQNAQNDLATQKALTGGYMPNYAAAQANLARQSNYSINDANTSANASIASAIQQGKLAGLQGLLGSQNMFGNQMLAANAQNLQNTGLQNQANQIAIQGKLGQSQIPGNFQQGAGNVGTALNLGGAGATFLNGLMNRNGPSASNGYQNPPQGYNSSANLSSIYNTLSGQNYNNANNGAGLGNVNGPTPGQNQTYGPNYNPTLATGGSNVPNYTGVDPNTGLMPGEIPTNIGGGISNTNVDPYNVPISPISQNYNIGLYGDSPLNYAMYTPMNSGPVDNYLGYDTAG